MFAIKFHSGTKQVEVLAASLSLRHQKVTVSITGMPRRPTTRKNKQTLNTDATVIPFLTNQALVFKDTNGFLGTKNDYLFQEVESEKAFRRGSKG